MRPSLILHGGAGIQDPELCGEREQGLRRAFAAGWDMLTQHGCALDAVVRAVVALEDDPVFNAGAGACLTEAGTIELDASVMEGTTFGVGAVGAVRTVRNPILLAKAVMELQRHVFLVGEGAERFARRQRIPLVQQEELTTPRQLQRWQTRKQSTPGTVGAVALDKAGRLAAATSTGGVANKMVGRIGDSAVIGAGTYADDRLGASSATGKGEAIIRTTLTRLAVEWLRDGRDPMWVAKNAIALLQQRTQSEAGLILIDSLGRIGYAYNTPAMSVAFLVGDVLVVQE
ncbi:MAG: isoaspartyl peptidase/L-asparaginase family protein [Candidatus Binatia bacterium]